MSCRVSSVYLPVKEIEKKIRIKKRNKKTRFFRRYGTKCGGCGQGLSPTDLVRKARDKVYHLRCFTCALCRRQLSTGEELYLLDDARFLCKEDFVRGKSAPGKPSVI